MKHHNVLLAALLAAVALPGLAADPAPGANPGRPGMSDAERAKLEAMTPEQRQAYMRDMRRDRRDGDNDGIPDRMEQRLTEEQQAKLKAMSPEQRRQYMREMRMRHEQRVDRDNNPPGPRGGPGTNWDNPPGPRGGPGAGPDPVMRHLSPEERARLQNMSPEQRQHYMQEMRNKYRDRLDRDNNPPGAAGGPGTNWENPPGPRGGPGASPDIRDRDNNPPGPEGGRGTNWENPPGPRGGAGASPDRRMRHDRGDRGGGRDR